MGTLTDDKPPVPRYRFTLTVTGNTLDEIESELVSQTRGGFLLDSDYYKRDEWEVWGGVSTGRMEHLGTNIARNMGKAKRRECRVYECGACGRWHLTSKPRMTVGGAT